MELLAKGRYISCSCGPARKEHAPTEDSLSLCGHLLRRNFNAKREEIFENNVLQEISHDSADGAVNGHKHSVSYEYTHTHTHTCPRLSTPDS